MRSRIKNINIKKLSRRGFVSSKVLRVGGVLVLAILLIGFLNGRTSNNNSNSGGRVEVADAIRTEDVNSEFAFPIKNGEGEELSRIKFIITKVEIRDQLIVQNQKVNSKNGRTYLVVNLKITNDFEKPIQMTSRDYIRLSVNGNEEEWLAPELHNDPVEVQAISTKLTRLAFPINDDDRSLVLQIGEIKGDKEKLELSITR